MSAPPPLPKAVPGLRRANLWSTSLPWNSPRDHPGTGGWSLVGTGKHPSEVRDADDSWNSLAPVRPGQPPRGVDDWRPGGRGPGASRSVASRGAGGNRSLAQGDHHDLPDRGTAPSGHGRPQAHGPPRDSRRVRANRDPCPGRSDFRTDAAGGGNARSVRDRAVAGGGGRPAFFVPVRDRAALRPAASGRLA
jgi:hypothetical protein